MFLCKIGMATARQKGLDILAVLAVIQLVCLDIFCLRYSTENAGSQRDQKTSGRMSAMGEALPKQQQNPNRPAKTSGGGQNSMKTPVDEAASVESKSAIDAFVVHRHVPPVEDAAQAASDMNDVMDEMLNRSEIPADYAETMVALSRDKSQGDVIGGLLIQ